MMFLCRYHANCHIYRQAEYIRYPVGCVTRCRFPLDFQFQSTNYYKDNPILNLPNVEWGGTGFYYDKAPRLSEEVEHCMPDYHLYDEWVEIQRLNGVITQVSIERGDLIAEVQRLNDVITEMNKKRR